MGTLWHLVHRPGVRFAGIAFLPLRQGQGDHLQWLEKSAARMPSDCGHPIKAVDADRQHRPFGLSEYMDLSHITKARGPLTSLHLSCPHTDAHFCALSAPRLLGGALFQQDRRQGPLNLLYRHHE